MSMTDAGSANAGPAAQPGQNGSKSGLIAYFAGNPVAANLLMVLLIVGGVLSGLQLVVQYYPDIEARQAAVTVYYPGASPKEVEEDINRRIEESVIGLPGVERVVATASQSIGRVIVEIATFADADAVFNDIQSAVDSIENFPPVRAEQPEVVLFKLAHEVMTLAVTSAALSENALRLAAEDLRDRVLALPSVSQVALKGTRDREITIELSEEQPISPSPKCRRPCDGPPSTSPWARYGRTRAAWFSTPSPNGAWERSSRIFRSSRSSTARS